MVYLLLEAKEEFGYLILKNKSSGKVKVIKVELDYGYAESLLKKCEEIERHIRNGTLPDPMDDPTVCGFCPWQGRECLPPADFGEGVQVVDDVDLLEMLERRRELEPLVREFGELDKTIKARFKGTKLAVVGNLYRIEGKEVVRTEKPRPEPREVRYWTTRITYLGSEEGSYAKGSECEAQG